MAITQHAGEKFTKYLACLKGQAEHADFTLECGKDTQCCGQNEGVRGCTLSPGSGGLLISYSEDMISSQAVRGLASDEHKREVLKSMVKDSLSKIDLSWLTKFITALEESGEAAKSLRGGAEVNGMSQHQQNRNANNKGNGNGNNKGGTTTSSPSKVSCFGCGSPKHKKGDKSCRANGKTCSNCQKVGHFPSVCPTSSSNGGGSAKRSPAKSNTNGKAATISKEEPTQSDSGGDSGPEADSNVISGGFFAIGGLQSVVSDERLAHYICDQFGKWKRTPVSKHGMVELSVKPCDKFYHQHNLRVPTGRPKCSSIIGLVDTGAQMCVAGEDFLSLTGIT